MRRNQGKFHDSILHLVQENKKANEERKILMDTVAELRDEVKLLNFKKKMDTVSVLNFFPIKNQQQIFEFMDDSDGMFQARLNGFYEYLFLIRAQTKKQFKGGLKTHLFTDEYCEAHHWPNIV